MMKLMGSADASKCSDNVEPLPDTTASFTISTEEMVVSSHDLSHVVSEELSVQVGYDTGLIVPVGSLISATKGNALLYFKTFTRDKLCSA